MINMGNTPFNYSRWKSPEYDALMNKAADTLDLGERAKALAEAETLFAGSASGHPDPLLFLPGAGLDQDRRI